ncbi:MAG: arylsulfatase [Opitutaceae bacterium]|nr:arylsulfatase [Opitutaceae bacterium]
MTLKYLIPSLICFVGTTLFAQERPNIVLIMTDDQGYGDLSIMGNPVLETPHIDSLAREGASMDAFYVSPVCSPTRASLMTGRYAYRTRLVDTFKGRSMMDPEEFTIAEALSDSGYKTGIFGKWHLGDNYPLRATDQGFQESLIHLGGGLGQPSEPRENNRRYTNAILFRNNQQVQTQGYCTDVYFDGAIEFIDQSLQAKKPFFSYIATNAPHSPYHDVPEALYRKYKNKDLSPVLLGNDKDADTVARVYAMVENIDQNVGKLLAHLDKREAARNTIVIFMVDNGPNTRRYIGPSRGKKNEVHDGGIRSPFFMRWPAQLKAGAHNDQIAAHIDVMPTLLEAAQVTLPPNHPFDGRSILPLLKGESPEWPDRSLILQIHRGDAPTPLHHIAVREQRWKLAHPTGFSNDIMPSDIPFELYDMEADPGETDNLYEQRPEISKRLMRTYERWFADVSSTRPDNYAPPRIILGTPHETHTTLSTQDMRATDDGGAWLLSFENNKTYDVEFLWKEPVANLTLELQVGNVRKTLNIKSATDTDRIQNIKIPNGNAALSARILNGNKKQIPYHIVLIQK